MARKVQGVGYSTLAVSLPKDWADEVGLNKGDIVTFEKENDGSLRITAGTKDQIIETRKSIIFADKCKEPELLTRIMTASYILGFDTIQIISEKGLTPSHLEEIRSTINRVTGIGIVEQTLEQVTIQSFVDPGKFPAEGLIRRLHIIASSMQLASMRALFENKPELAKESLRMEYEADRIYWLILRHIRFDMQKVNLIGGIGEITGNRLIAKCLEEMADNAEHIAKEVLKIDNFDFSMYEDAIDRLSKLDEMVQYVSRGAMKALSTRDIIMANDTIETMKLIDKEGDELLEFMLNKLREIDNAIYLRFITISLREIARWAIMIAEVAINRIVRKRGTEIMIVETEKVSTIYK